MFLAVLGLDSARLPQSHDFLAHPLGPPNEGALGYARLKASCSSFRFRNLLTRIQGQ